MKAITLTQPWATLVAIGAKQIETRSWSTDYRGPLAIHAAKTMPNWAIEAASYFGDVLRAAGYTTRTQLKKYKTWGGEKWLPSGVIVATCELVGVDQFGKWMDDHNPVRWARGKYFFELTEQERAFGDYSFGRYGFFLANVKPLPEPIPAKGALGLWDWEPEGVML